MERWIEQFRRWTSGVGVGLCAVAFGACKHDGPGNPSSATSASVSQAAPVASPASALNTAETPHDPAPAATQAAGEAPSSFASGAKIDVEGAVGLGCEAKSQDGWLELSCRKRNGTGGHPVRAVLDPDAGTETLADEHGELRVTAQLSVTRDIPIEWSDTTHALHVEGGTAKLVWQGGLPLRRACSEVLDATKAVLSAAQKADAPGRVLPAEGSKLPRLGVCFPAGKGSYAIGLRAIRAEGDGDARALHADLEVIHVDLGGKVLRAPYASFAFAPGGLTVKPLQVYDFDDDGRDEAIVPYDLAASHGDAPTPAAVWSSSDTAVTPYAKAPPVAQGGVTVEQLDFDMRPDIGTYGPFVTFLAPCSDGCPSRIVGPLFYAHSLPDGSFADNDAATQGALKRACSKRPEAVVVLAGKKVQIAQTAKNLACARVWGATPESVQAELDSHRDALCSGAEHCPLTDALSAWSKATPKTLSK
jgi:hypothetical protein